MSRTSPDYEAERKKELNKNRVHVLSDLNNRNPGLLKKVCRRAEKFGYEVEEVIRKIKEDEMFADTFAKDPTKQRIDERTAAEFIKNLDKVENFEDLPNDRLSISNGAVIERNELRNRGGQTQAKTIDFMWACGDKKFYASHKYTKESGGSQDLQYRDLQAFITQANHSADANNYFIAIADGDYYKGQNGTVGVSKLQNLKNLALNQRNVYAMEIGELEEFLNRHC